jgi:hypothetical protein
MSFFGLPLRRVREPEMTSDGVALVASLLDLAACKIAVLPQRAEAKDYIDIYALLKNGMELKDAIGAAQTVYGERFNALLSLKALTYFGDGDLPALPENAKQALRSAAVVDRISNFEPLPEGIVPSGSDFSRL